MESQPDQEQPMNAQGDISSFSLTDQVGNLFRSHKLGKNSQKAHARPTKGERAVNLRAEEQSMFDGRLPPDEQEECYKQQNIQSPSQEEPSRGKWVQEQEEPQGLPIMGMALKPQARTPNDVGLEVNEKLDNMLGRKVIEKQEVDSLYSDPEQVLKLKKVKPSYQLRSPEVFSDYSRVYKPVGVEAEFPVYDEDLDFHPDPLQGILDDKYWLDPQEQETVIRKYIDLAANNMMPSGVYYKKRNTEKGDHKVKSVNSKIGFKNSDNQCPCKEISSCGDCSKGKKKNNYSESVGDNLLYGRKLLSIVDKAYKIDKLNLLNSYEVPNLRREKRSNYDQNSYISDFPDRKNSVSFGDEDTPFDESKDDLASVKDRTYMSQEDIPYIPKNEEVGEFNDDSIKKHNVIGRNILWYGVYDEDEESYNDEGEEEEHSHSFLGKVSSDGQATNKDAVDWVEDNNSNTQFKYSEPEHFLDENTSGHSHKYLDSNSLTSNGNKLNQGLQEIMPPFKAPNKPPGYYTSNKLANMIQKPFQEKPKGPKKNKTDDPSYEFEVIRNKTLYNATFEATSEKPPRPKVCYKRGSRNYLSAPKNRRSYSNLPLVGKNEQIVHLFQPSGDSIGSDFKDGKPASTSSTKSDLSSSQSQATQCPSVSKNITTMPPNKTDQLLSNHTAQSSKTKFDDGDAEENVDAEVANDIVETVISESEKSSVLGHNLGICKKNESVTKMKYGQIVPEAEKVLKLVTDCIMDRIKAHLALQSCILLDNELLEFLKWMVLSGESYKEYMQRLGPKYYDFVPTTTANVTTCGPPTTQMCEQEPLPPNPNVVSSLNSNSAKVYR